MAALPVLYNIQARTGHLFQRRIVYSDAAKEPIDLTGYTAIMPIRQVYSSGFVRQLSVGNGITITPADGAFELTISATEMETIPSRSYVYDLILIPPSGEADRFALLTGSFVVHPRVQPAEAS